MDKNVIKEQVKDSLIQEMDNQLSHYKSLNIDKMESDLNAYERLGSPEEIMELANKFESAMKELDQYKKFGSVEDIHELCESYSGLADNVLESDSADAKLLAQYEAFGSVQQVAELVNRFEEIKSESVVNDLSTRLNIDPQVVRNTLEKVSSVSDAEEILQEIVESAPLKSFRHDKGESARFVRSSRRSDGLEKLRKVINHNI